MITNEEALRSHVLIPFLKALGISYQQIEIERVMRLRLGRVTHELADRTVIGRADLLVKNLRGENLFLLELKHPDEVLDDADRDQAISYARLLDQIAPFVLLSNGKESRLFDTITKEPLGIDSFTDESAFYAAGCQLATAEDIRIRWEALRHFIGYSRANLEAFSRAHVNAQIRPLTGLTGREGKYVRDLHVRRKELGQAVAAFLTGSEAIFAVIGDSGVGKTNELCSLAEELSRTHVVLFFAAHEMSHGPGETLLEEFNWNFSQQLHEPELFQRLAALATEIGHPVVIIIDGVDESTIAQYPSRLNDFARHVCSQKGAVRLVLSAKSTEWPRFSTSRGNPTTVALELAGDWRDGSDKREDRRSRPFVLSEFTETELDLATAKYKKFYSLPEIPSGTLRTLCRTPFFLRVVGETYAGATGQLPLDMTGSDLARNWLEGKFARMDDPATARDDLDLVVAAVYKTASDPLRDGESLASKEWVESRQLARRISGELLSHGVISQAVDRDGRIAVRLTHSRILSYLLARRVLRLDLLDEEEFRALLPSLFASFVTQSALAWHMKEAPPLHIRVLADLVRGRAAMFVAAYSRILETTAGGFRHQIDPKTPGDIGIAYFVTEWGLGWCGLFPIGEATEERVVEFRARDEQADIGYLHRLGCRYITGGGMKFLKLEPIEAAADYALRRITEAVRSGLMVETGSETLVTESVLAIASTHRHALGLSQALNWRLPFASLVPLPMKPLHCTLQRWFAREFHLRQWVDAERWRQSAAQFPNAPPESDYVELTQHEYGAAEVSGRLEADAGRIFSELRVQGKGELAYLAELVLHLIKLDLDILNYGPLLLPLARAVPVHAPFHAIFTDEELGAVIGNFFDSALLAYKELVDGNLSGLRTRLRTYSRLPSRVLASYARPPIGNDSNQQRWGRLEWALVPVAPGETGRTTVWVGPEERIFRRSRDGSGDWVGPLEARLPWGFTVTDLASIFHASSAPPFGTLGGHSDAPRNAPIRAFVYSLLQSELANLTPRDLLEAAKLEPR